MADENKQKLEMIYIKLNALGWRGHIEHHDDGSIIGYYFMCYDKLSNDECYWEVCIEDHHGVLPLDDWIIYISYHQPSDAFIYASGAAIEFETMKLFMEFIEILESERLEAKNNPIAYLRKAKK